MTRPKIALFIRWLRGGGAERVIANIAIGLAKRGVDVDLVLVTADGLYLKDLPPEVNIVDLGVQSFDHGKSFRLPTSFQATGSLLKLVDYLKTNQPQLLIAATHFMNEIAVLATRIARVKTRVLVSEHTTLSVEAQQAEQITSRLAPLSARFLYPFADGVIAVSGGVAQDLSQLSGIARHRIQVLYNPVITSDLYQKAAHPIDHPWFQAADTPIVIGSGRFVRQKDFSTLIRAFAQVRQQRPARLVLLGDGRDKPTLQALVHELSLDDDVWFPGFVSNPYAYVAKASVFVLSSLWEGLPTTLIEAMALNIPVVSTNCPSGPVEILHQGKYGALVPMGDAGTMAQAIQQGLQGQLTLAPKEYIEQFTSDSATQGYLNLLDTLEDMPAPGNIALENI